MTKKFDGTINIDVRESTPDWTPYEQPKAAPGSPNVLFIVWDDTGFGALSPFGGPIRTPTMDRLAKGGLRYTQFHTTALCSPTRASLLTGRNHTTVGMACICEATTGFPGSNGHIPFETATIAEVLSERGYNTYMLGKWHCCPEDETNMASTKRNWPTGRGFERYYGFLGGETNQWYPDLVQDQQFVDQPYDPPANGSAWADGLGDRYHLSKDLVDRAIAMIADAKQVAPEKPFFMYFCPGANHAPHHAPKEWADRYRGAFDHGYEALREAILANQKRMGIVPPNTELSPMNPYADEHSIDGTPWSPLDVVRPWDSLSDDEKKLFARMAEVYAGFCSYTDDQIGRLIDYLEQTGELDNTMIVVVSDNGASGEGGPNGSVNENKFFNGVMDDITQNLEMVDRLGSPDTYNHYAIGWAMAFNTPFKLWKRFSYNGGICDPMIVHWPRGVAARGEIRDQYTHCSDVVPTVYECLGIEPPETVKGYTQWPLEGESFRYSFSDPAAATRKTTQYYVMLGTRAIWHQGWKADAVHPAAPGGWDHFTADRWELYHTDEDRSECHDLAERHPERLEQLKSLWFHEAGRYLGLPLDDRTAVEVLTTPRPQLSPPRDRYVYYPGTLEVPEAVAVNVRGRSFTIAAQVRLVPGAQGTIFAQGSKFGGHALYIKDGRLKYVYNYLGLADQAVESSTDVPANGTHVLGVRFTQEETAAGAATGTATLFIDDAEVGEYRGMRTQLGKFALSGEGLTIGRDSSANVTDDYPGDRPWAFNGGGRIERVVVDVSGEAFVDLEREALGMMKRD
jgi:arylsulfatase A-like enzyme